METGACHHEAVWIPYSKAAMPGIDCQCVVCCILVGRGVPSAFFEVPVHQNAQRPQILGQMSEFLDEFFFGPKTDIKPHILTVYLPLTLTSS